MLCAPDTLGALYSWGEATHVGGFSMPTSLSTTGNIALIATLCLLFGCDPDEPFRFFEPRNTTGSTEWPLLFEINQAAGRDRLSILSGRITEVRYSTEPSRHVPFLLRGDIAIGSPLEALQLPPTASSETERITDVTSFDIAKWTSFRVYDRGDCSVLLDWNTTSSVLANEIIRQLNDNSRVRNAQLHPNRDPSQVRPSLVTLFPAQPLLAPLADVDELAIDLEVQAAELGPCESPDFTINLAMSLNQTGDAVYRIPGESYFAACKLGLDTSDERWLKEDFAEDRLADLCSPLDIPCISDLIDRFNQFLLNIDSGIVPDCDATLASRHPLSDVDSVRSLEEFSGRENDQDAVLIGYRDIFGQQTGASDVVAAVTDVGFSNFNAPFGCVLEGAVRRVIRREFRKKLPLGMRDAILGLLVIDPWVWSGELTSTTCDTDADCDFRDGSPAYTSGGDFRGVRHRCLDRDPERARALSPTLGDFLETQPPGRFCHVQLEPDHLNIRPDGVEVVLAFDEIDDPQSSLLPRLSSIGADFCANDRPGSLLSTQAPLFHEEQVPILVPGE